MITEHAYSTDDEAAVAAYRQALADQAAYTPRIRAAVEALGHGPNVVIRHGLSGTPDRLFAVEVGTPGMPIPDGWRIIQGQLQPRRGGPGQLAREWLAAHQPVDVRHVMEAFGLPRSSMVPADGFRWRMVTPKLFEHRSTLWACYEGEPGAREVGLDSARCAWAPRKLSEFHAAWENFQVATAGVAS